MSTTIPVPRDSRAADNGFLDGMNNPQLERLLEQWRQGALWHDTMPRDVRQKLKSLDDVAAWKKWADYLAARKSTAASPLINPKNDPLDWALPAGDTSLAAVVSWRAALDRQLAKSTSKRAFANLETIALELVRQLQPATNGPITADVALRAVVAAYRLPQLATCTDSLVWWQLAAALLELATTTEPVTGEELEPQPVLVGTLLAGELPLVLSVQLAELKPFRQLRPAARKSLGEGLLAATDGEGLVDAVLLPVLPALFASWTRTRTVGEQLKKSCWSSSAESQFEWLVRQTIRLLRPSGVPMLSSQTFINWPAGPLDTAIELAGDDQDDAAAAAHLARVLPAVDYDYDDDDLPEPSVESEWSTLAVLANGWDKKSTRVLVDYSQPVLNIEVESHNRTLVSGGWETEVSLAGKTLRPVDEWEQQCWFSDDDCDFLDLMIELTGGVRLERQLFLGKEDNIFVTHDILHAPQGKPGEWQYTASYSLFENITFAGEEETRDGVLLDGKRSPRASVLPLALAEWRVEPRFGELTAADGKLQLSQQAQGLRMSCPLWFDLSPRRVPKPRTWRRLTVAASLEVAPSDVAVGYRTQCGDAQWLLYRSLAPPANRTVLGQNTSSEMLIGRFLRTGELDELLEVDPA